MKTFISTVALLAATSTAAIAGVTSQDILDQTDAAQACTVGSANYDNAKFAAATAKVAAELGFQEGDTVEWANDGQLVFDGDDTWTSNVPSTTYNGTSGRYGSYTTEQVEWLQLLPTLTVDRAAVKKVLHEDGFDSLSEAVTLLEATGMCGDISYQAKEAGVSWEDVYSDQGDFLQASNKWGATRVIVPVGNDGMVEVRKDNEEGGIIRWNGSKVHTLEFAIEELQKRKYDLTAG